MNDIAFVDCAIAGAKHVVQWTRGRRQVIREDERNAVLQVWPYRHDQFRAQIRDGIVRSVK